MANKSRLYQVTTPTAVRLIEAPNAARAIAHVVRQEIKATIPAQHEVYALARSGVLIEVVGDIEISDETRNAVAQTDLSVD
jgi:16S rRNA A1518/A1519 N6-dimethyltransferase RsmA/KsgA/DIM1 with predicted DNA glycosylase/AP lyase activity